MGGWYCANFTHDEMKCPCCDRQAMDERFMARLQRAREIAGTPFDIRNGSGWRCVEHNREIGGVPESSHLTGHAVDIPVWSSEQRFAIINGLIKAGFKRVGIAKTFIHADDSVEKSQHIMWMY